MALKKYLPKVDSKIVWSTVAGAFLLAGIVFAANKFLPSTGVAGSIKEVVNAAK